MKKNYVSSDFNVDVMEKTSQQKQILEFITLAESFGFKANFVTPTRITDTRKSCIDNNLSLKF